MPKKDGNFCVEVHVLTVITNQAVESSRIKYSMETFFFFLLKQVYAWGRGTPENSY